MSTTQPAGTYLPDDWGALLHEHTVSISRDTASQTHLFTSALSAALTDGRSCAFISDRTAPSALREHLAAKGADVERAEREGRLTMLAAADTYTRAGIFEPERMLGLLADRAGTAEKMGVGPMFAVGELTWLADPVPGSDRLLEYEYLINEVDELRRCGIICVYDGATLPSAVARDLAAVHPSVHSDSGLALNADFSIDGELAGDVRLADELEPPVNGTSCRYLASMASAYADGELADKRKADIDRHVANCAMCARAMRNIGDTKTALGRLRTHADAPVGFMHSLRERIASER